MQRPGKSLDHHVANRDAAGRDGLVFIDLDMNKKKGIGQNMVAADHKQFPMRLHTKLNKNSIMLLPQ